MTELVFDVQRLSEQAVRERFANASRNGNPLWLWPEISIQKWELSLDAIEDVARRVLADARVKPHLCGSPNELGLAGYTSGMGPLLGYWIASGRITADPDVGSLFATHFRHNRLRMKTLALRLAEISLGFSSAGIQATILKGMHTAFAFFPVPGTRPMSDIDLLVAPHDRKAAEEILRALGYVGERSNAMPPERTWRLRNSPELPRSLCFVHADDPWSIDLQFSLNRQASAHVVPLDKCLLLERCQKSDQHPGLHVLPVPTLALHLACHASCDPRSLSLIRIVELILVIRQSQSIDSFWDDFSATASLANALPIAYPALNLCEVLAPGIVPQSLLLSSRMASPEAVRRVVGRLTPGRAQSVGRCSLEERFMWNKSPLASVRQVFSEVIPPSCESWSELLAIYHNRAHRLWRGTITR